jgi:hypothetical protein
LSTTRCAAGSTLLTAEAVAAAVVLGARIAVSTASPLLAAAASSVDIIVITLD